MRNRLLFAAFCFFLPLFCSAQDATISISATARGALMSGFGIIVHIQNMETHELYHSKSLSAMSPNAVVEHLPAGRYEVCAIEVPFGDRWFQNISKELRDFFGIIDVEPNHIYYLGTYKTTYKGISRVVFTHIGNEVSKGLRKWFEEQGRSVDDIIVLEPVQESFLLQK